MIIPPIHAQFKEVNNAKTILLNEKKRRIYDQYGSMGLKLAEQVGEDNLDLYMCLDSKLMKVCKTNTVYGDASVCLSPSLPPPSLSAVASRRSS